jgi:hypothetical protein
LDDPAQVPCQDPWAPTTTLSRRTRGTDIPPAIVAPQAPNAAPGVRAEALPPTEKAGVFAAITKLSWLVEIPNSPATSEPPSIADERLKGMRPLWKGIERKRLGTAPHSWPILHQRRRAYELAEKTDSFYARPLCTGHETFLNAAFSLGLFFSLFWLSSNRLNA